MNTETRHRHTRRFFAFAAALAVFPMAACDETRDVGPGFKYRVEFSGGGADLGDHLDVDITSATPEESLLEVTATVACFEENVEASCPAGYVPVWSIPDASLGVEKDRQYFSILAEVINPTTLKITLKFRKSKLLAIQADNERAVGHSMPDLRDSLRVDATAPDGYERDSGNDLNVSLHLPGTYPQRSVAPP